MDKTTAPDADRDLSLLLLCACKRAATDFAAAVAWLRPRMIGPAAAEVCAFVSQRLSMPEPGVIACTIYLLAQAHSADLAAAAGWHALEGGCDDDQVIIALADVLQAQTRPRQTAAAMMHQRCSDHRSTAFLIKLADHYRTGGQAFLAEDVLRDMIARGRHDLVLRLSEHWFEQQDWRSARDQLRQLTPDQVTGYTMYLAARCAASLLLEDEVIHAADALMTMPEPGPQYAALLRCVWTWRVGNPVDAARDCPDANFPPLAARDAAALRRAHVQRAATLPLPAPGIWRSIGSRDNLPNVLGIGMQRTATTWLWKQLSKHPDVEARSFKELVFFSDPFDSLDRHGSDLRSASLGEDGDRYWQGPTRSLLHYRHFFASRKPLRIDISPSYAELPDEAVMRIREILGPEVKIILSVRDPVERTWSNLKYDLKTTGKDPLEFSFRQRTALYRSTAALRRCDYASVVRTWRRSFRHLKVIFTDDVVARPAELIAELSRFIDFSLPIDEDSAKPVNTTDNTDMPRDDRMFLFGLHQQSYAGAEAELAGPALGWRRRQLSLLEINNGSDHAASTVHGTA